jgi:hypothetical protein
MFETIVFTRHTPTGDGPWFDARSTYVERVWTSALGCTSIAVLRAAATTLDAGTPLHLDGHELAGRLGLKLHSASHSSFLHSLQRLERFGLAGLNDPTVVIQTLLPPLPERLLRRAPRNVHIAHEHLLAAAQHIERTKVETHRQ